MLLRKMDSNRFQEILTEKRSEINETVKFWVKNHLIEDSERSFLGLPGASRCVMWLLDKPQVTRAANELASENPILPLAGFLHDDASMWQGKHFLGYLRAVLAALKIVDDELAVLSLPVLEDEDRQTMESLVQQLRRHRKEFLHQFARIETSEDLYEMLELYGQTVHGYIVELSEKLLSHSLHNCLSGFLEYSVTQWINQ